VPGDLAQLFPGSGQVNKPAIVVHGSNSAVRISRLHGPHFKSDTLKIVDDPRNRNPIFGVVLDLNVDKIHARLQFEVGKRDGSIRAARSSSILAISHFISQLSSD